MYIQKGKQQKISISHFILIIILWSNLIIQLLNYLKYLSIHGFKNMGWVKLMKVKYCKQYGNYLTVWNWAIIRKSTKQTKMHLILYFRWFQNQSKTPTCIYVRAFTYSRFLSYSAHIIIKWNRSDKCISILHITNVISTDRAELTF